MTRISRITKPLKIRVTSGNSRKTFPAGASRSQAKAALLSLLPLVNCVSQSLFALIREIRVKVFSG
jgi:hypothetical protein